ncbi:MAG: hypothetical protein KJ607_02695, partial [Bacteroidetes bacterium]|nr:hypothetical protein [Bacteroidota bacterium]
MRHTKYFRIALYISFSLILATFHYSCNDKKEGSESQTVNKDIADSIPVITIKKDSLTIITPGQDSVPLPQKYTAGQPKIVPTNTNIHPVPEIKPIPAGKPNIIRVVQTHGRVSQPDDTLNRIYSFTPALSEVEVNPATGDTLHALEAIPINFDSVPVITAGIPEVTIAKDPYIRDQNPQNFSSFSKLQGLKHDVIRCMLQDRTGNLWFGTSGGGVSKYDGDHVVASNTIENKQSVRESFTHFTEKEGLSNNYVFGMALDKNDNLWFGTRFGLSKLPALKRAKLEEIFKKNIGKDGRPSVPTNEVFFKTYGYYDGFLGIGVNGGNTGKNVYEASDGTIWIAANDRLTAYHPEGYVPDTIPPNVQLTGIELFGENIQWVNLIGGYAGSNGRSTLRSAKDTSFTLNNGIEVASETENGVLICGKDGTFEWVNRGFERLYGLTLEEYTAKHGKTIYETSSNPGFQQVVNEAVEHSSSITYNSQFTKETGHT